MNVLLIGPYSGVSSHKDIEQKLYMEKMFLAPPLGIYRIASYLKSKHNVKVFDPNLDDPYRFLDKESKNYQVIGVSMTHPTLEHDLSLIWQAKKCNSNSLLIAGGEEASFNYSQVFEFSPVDIVVLGEGEIPLLKICETIPKVRGKDLKEFMSTPGLIIRDEEKVAITGPNSLLSKKGFREVSMSLDFDDIPYEKYWSFIERMYEQLSGNASKEVRTIRMFTSNYCPFRCTFCSSTNFHEYSCGVRPKFTLLTAEDLLSLVERVTRSHPLVKTVFFHDDNFTLGRYGQERAIKLSKAIIKYKQQNVIAKDLSFVCQTRVDSVSETMLELMSKAGFRIVSYGIESFSQNMLDEFNKKITLNQIANALNYTYKAKIKPFINIIMTSPNCQSSDVWLTATECVEHLKLGAEIGLNPYLMPFPGADILKKEEVQKLVEYQEVQIPRTSVVFRKAGIILPKDGEVRDLLSTALIELSHLQMRGRISSASKSVLTLYSTFLAFRKLGGYGNKVEKYINILKTFLE